MNKIKILLAFTILLTIVGCGEKEGKESLTIYTTNYAQKFIIESIGLDYVDVYSIYDNTNEFDIENNEDFVYEVKDPSTFSFEDNSELKKIVLDSDAFIYNGKSDDDKRIVNELFNDKKSEDLLIFDTTESADVSTVEKNMGLSYNNQVVNEEIKPLLTSNEELEMFWLSPVEMQNVSIQLYNFLVELMPEKKQELKENFNSLMYDLDSLYANIEEISNTTINNMIVSDTVELNILKVHYIENIYTDQTKNNKYKDDETNQMYLEDIAQYITIEPDLTIQTTSPSGENYFDLMVVQSEDNYNEGINYYQMTLNNYQVLYDVMK